MKKTGKEIRETEGQFIMQQEVVDWEKVECSNPNALKGASVQDIKDASVELSKTGVSFEEMKKIKGIKAVIGQNGVVKSVSFLSESFVKVVDPKNIQKPKHKVISMPDGSKCIFFTEKDKYKALGICSGKLLDIKIEDKDYINHSLFYNDISEVWVCMIFYFD